MKKICYIEFQMTDSGMEEVFRDDHAYDGPWEYCGGGPSAEQKTAAAKQGALSDEELALARTESAARDKLRGAATPFYTTLMTNGDPNLEQKTDFASGLNARSFAPAKAALMRRIGPSSGLPSGYRDASLSDFDEARARAYDDSLSGILDANQAAKERGAAGVTNLISGYNPQSYFQGSAGANQSILQAPLQRPGMSGLIGGILGAGATAYAGR